MHLTQTKDFIDDLSGLMDEVPEEEIPDVKDDNTVAENDSDDITLTDNEGSYALGLDNNDNVTR